MANIPTLRSAPSMDDTILSALRAISERDQQKYLVGAAQSSGQPDYSINRSSDDAFDNAPDDNDGSDLMIAQTGGQDAQPDIAQFLPQIAPQLMDGSDGGAAFSPSPEDWAQALGEYAGQSPQGDGTSPATGMSAQDWAQALSEYAGLPQRDGSSITDGILPGDFAHALAEYPQSISLQRPNSGQGLLQPISSEVGNAPPANSVAPVVAANNGVGPPLDAEGTDVSNPNKPDSADLALNEVTEGVPSGLPKRPWEAGSVPVPGLNVDPALRETTEEMRSKSEHFADLLKKLEASDLTYKIRLGTLPPDTPADSTRNPFWREGTTTVLDPDQISRTKYITESGDEAQMTMKRAIIHELSHSLYDGLLPPPFKLIYPHRFIIDNENRIMNEIDPSSPNRNRNDDTLHMRK